MAEHTIMLTDLYLQLIAAIISYCFPFFVSFCLTEIEKGNLSVGLLMDHFIPFGIRVFGFPDIDFCYCVYL